MYFFSKVLVCFFALMSISSASEKQLFSVVGYFPGYSQSFDTGLIDYMSDDDWSLVTHVVHNSALPNPDGTLSFDSNKVHENNRRMAIKYAHDHDVPILFGVSGWGESYQSVLDDPALRKKLIENIMLVFHEGYDGIDIDFEPLVGWGEEDKGNPAFETFIADLHAVLKKEKTPLLEQAMLTAAVGHREREMLARLADKIDMFLLMAYDLVGVMGEVTWHDSALKDGGFAFPSTGEKVPSVASIVRMCLDAGIPANKLILGISLETRAWVGGSGTPTGGVTEPRQTWKRQPGHFWTDSTVPLGGYNFLMDNLYSDKYYKWDDAAKVPYLKINKACNCEDMFVSFNDPRSVEAKVNFAEESGLGGVMLWHLQMDYRPSVPVNQQRPIMDAIRKAISD